MLAPGRARRGFSLLEVLLAMALATLVLGPLLQGAALQTLRIARLTSRYQALLHGSAALSRAASGRFRGEESGEVGGYIYRLSTRTVPADPRVDRLHVEVEGPRRARAALDAYRLRVRREDPPPPDAGSPPIGEGAAP